MAIFIQSTTSYSTTSDCGVAAALREMAPRVGLGALAFTAAVVGTDDSSASFSLGGLAAPQAEVAALRVETSMTPDTASDGSAMFEHSDQQGDNSVEEQEAGDSSSLELPSAGVASLLQRAVLARGNERSALLEVLKGFPPLAALQATLETFREMGNTDRLELACRLLDAAGLKALPALEFIATTPAPGQSAFVPLAAHAPFLSQVNRARILAEFARSSEYETRSEVLSVAETLPDHEVLAALEILAKDTDAELAEEASAELLALRERLSVERDFPVSA
jgi:hypothetical protein